jgi:ubiquitin-protein ligase
MNRIEPFENIETARQFFNNWKITPFESGLTNIDKSTSIRIRNEFTNLYFNNKSSDLYKLRLNWENPSPVKWYVNLFYDQNTFSEMNELFETNPLTLEIDLGYKYPFKPPKITLITFKYNIGETLINQGKINSDGRIEHNSLIEFVLPEENSNMETNTYLKSWSPASKLSDIISELYIEIAVSYQRFGKLMFY